MPDSFWDAVFVIVGGVIAALTTYIFEKRQQYRTKKSLGLSLFLKASEAINDVTKVRREILMHIVKFEREFKRPPTPDEYWNAITPSVDHSVAEIHFSGEELALFESDGASIGALQEFLSFRRTLIGAYQFYSELRTRTEDALVLLTTFEQGSEGLKGTTEFDARKRPDLLKQVHTTKDLCKQIVALSEKAETRARRTADVINGKLPAKFNSGDFTLRIELPRAGELMKELD